MRRTNYEATVGDVMTRRVVQCAPDTPLRSVAQLMSSHSIHAVYVFDDALSGDVAPLWGLVTDLDVVAAWPVIDENTAAKSAVAPLITVQPDELLGRAAQLMAESGSGHLAVVDAVDGRPVGVVSTLDIARVLGAGCSGDAV